MSDEVKIVHHQDHRNDFPNQFPPPPPPPSVAPMYGTFEGIPPPPAPESGVGWIVHHHHEPGHRYPDDSDEFPPHGRSRIPPSYYYAHGYQAVPGYVAEGRPVNESPRPCFGLGVGGFLFMIFFFAVLMYILAQMF